VGLISSLLNVILSRDMPVRQPQQPHSKHHGATVLCPRLTMQGVNLYVKLDSGWETREQLKCCETRGRSPMPDVLVDLYNKSLEIMLVFELCHISLICTL